MLSGNRNFEARIHPEVKANYLASPPLVVAYALAGRIDIDLEHEPLAPDARRQRRLPARPLADLGARSRTTIASSVRGEMFTAHLRRRLHRRRGLAQPRDARRRPLRLGSRARPTSAGRPTSTGSSSSRARSPTSRAPAASSRSATRSRPTTSRRPARSGSTRRPAAT